MDIDDAILSYLRDHDEASLHSLHVAILRGELVVPIADPVQTVAPSHHDVPVICVRTSSGIGAIPAFTSVSKLLNWAPEGSQYALLTGRQLLSVALGMDDISEIVVNPNNTPRGSIPRSDFARMLSLQ